MLSESILRTLGLSPRARVLFFGDHTRPEAASVVRDARVSRAETVGVFAAEAKAHPSTYDAVIVWRPSVPATLSGFPSEAVIASAAMQALKRGGFFVFVKPSRESRDVQSSGLSVLTVNPAGGEGFVLYAHHPPVGCACARKG